MVSPTKLLLHCDGADAATTFADSSQSAHVVTAHGAAQLDTAQKEFGTASGYFTAAADYLSLDSATDFTFGTGDFTIETWIRRETTDVPVVLIDFRTSADLMPPYVYYDGSLKYYCNGADRITAAATLAVGSWHHVAVCRAGSATRMFLDGVQVGSTYVAADNLTCAPSGPIIGGVPVPLQAETTAWVAAVVAAGGSVSGARQTLVDNLIITLKSAGVFAKLDRLWIWSAENLKGALIDLVALDQAVAVNSPTFTVDRGITGNGVNSYIDTTFNVSTQGVNYKLVDAHMAVWDNTSRGVATSVQTGCYDGGTINNIFVYQNVFAVTGVDVSVNTAQGNGAFANSSSQGFFIGQISGDYMQEAFYEGVSLGSRRIDYSGTLINLTFFVCGRNDGGGFSTPTTDQISATSYGGAFTATTEAMDYRNALRTFMTAIGVP